jgi:hypothetical protein
MHSMVRGLILVVATLSLGALPARAELVTYTVNIVESGTIAWGSTIHWEVFATVSGSTASNFGIAALTFNLADSKGTTLSPGTFATPFATPQYDFTSGGTYNMGTLTLEEVGTTQFDQDANTQGADPVNGGSLGPLLVATGSYVVPMTQSMLGIHTLTLTAGSENRFFTALTQGLGASSLYSSVVGGSDSIEVVPEPASLWLMGLFAGSSWLLRLFRRTPRSSPA